MTDIKKTTGQKARSKQNSKHIINIDKEFAHKWLQIICLELPIYVLLLYFLVQALFFKTFKCSESENIRYCQCTAFAMSEGISFWGKINLMIINPSVEEMDKYVPLNISAKCHIQTMELIRSMQEYSKKTKENLEKSKDGIKNIFDKD